MWSGTTLTNFSGNILGVHQKVDRVAHRVVTSRLDNGFFPSKKEILHFEGKNGPDGIKSKSPAKNEPWHYIDPFDPSDTQLLKMIMEHYKLLRDEMRKGNEERASFEAAWLSHAIVDGMTPAHHYPYEEKLIELRKGESIETRVSVKEKLVMKGDNPLEVLRNNWSMWGFKGLIINHGAFEFGIAAIVSPLRFRQIKITDELISEVRKIGFQEYFLQNVREIALWNMYDDFSRYGWNWTLSKKVRDDLVPLIILTVSMAWYMAADEARYGKKGKTSK